MFRSKELLYKLVSNASLGFVYFGYSVGYMNPAQETVDVVFGITENVDSYNGLLAAIMTAGAAFGVLILPNILQLFSRRQSLMLLDLLGIIGYGLQLIGNWELLVVGRIISGFVLGLNSALVPVYVNEFAPKELIGELGSIMTMSGSLGLFISFLIGFGYSQTPTVDDQYWRIGFGIPLVICSIRSYNLLYNFKLDSPSYYVTKQDEDLTIQSIKFIYQEQYVNQIFIQLKQDQKQENSSNETYKDLYYGRLFKNLLRLCIMAFIGQLLGISAVIFYSTSIFNQVTNNNLSISKILNLLIPLLGILGAYLMGLILNKMTRKIFFLAGIIACVIVEAPLGYWTSLDQQPQILVALFILLFILFFSVTLGPAFWVVLPEMVNSKGVCLATSANWIATGLVGQVFPILVASFGISICFYIFTISGILGAIYVFYEFNPDSKSINLEKNQELEILSK